MLGGTFDPVHLGHCLLAEAAFEHCGLRRVVLVPNASPPHKSDRLLTPYRHRRRMAELAVEYLRSRGVDAQVSNLESDPRYVHYTVDTLRRMGECCDGTICLVIGSDEALMLPGWKDAAVVLDLAPVIVGMRGGDSAPPLSDIENTLRSVQPHARITVLPGTFPAIDSTSLRKRIAAGEDVSDLVPPGVYEYAVRERLYVPQRH